MDSGASNVIIGKSLSKALDIIPQNVEPGIAYATACGDIHTSLGTTKNKFPISIGKGANQAIVFTNLHLSPSDTFSVLLGNAFLVPIGAVIDTWTHRFHYFVNWDKGRKQMASIGIAQYQLHPAANPKPIQYMEMEIGTSVDILGREDETIFMSTHEENVLADYEFLVLENNLQHRTVSVIPTIQEDDYAKKNYSSFHGECLAVIPAAQHISDNSCLANHLP